MKSARQRGLASSRREETGNGLCGKEIFTREGKELGYEVDDEWWEKEDGRDFISIAVYIILP